MADPRLERTRARLAALQQSHLLHFADQLGPAALRTLLDQVEALPLEEMPAMLAQTQATAAPDPDGLEPVPMVSREGPDAAAFRAEGERLIREGRVAAFTVAGGQGTRLGWRGPKGTYPATVVTGKPLFRVFAEQLLATERRFGCRLPWYIMTTRSTTPTRGPSSRTTTGSGGRPRITSSCRRVWCPAWTRMAAPCWPRRARWPRIRTGTEVPSGPWTAAARCRTWPAAASSRSATSRWTTRWCAAWIRCSWAHTCEARSRADR
ncbi:MAG: hypothetical protein EBQ99_05720 [Planctomycetes bacterium]|nr:hypothetical protein [Planctomycetota bacterium]